MTSPSALKSKRIRIWIVLVPVFLFAAATMAKLFHLQVVEHERLTAYSKKQYFRKQTLSPVRGMIYDRNGNELAVNVASYSVFADPRLVNRKKYAAPIAKVLGMDAKSVSALLKQDSNFVWIKRKVTRDEFVAIKKLDIDGVHFVREFSRQYPNNRLGAKTIGFCGIDNQGLGGVELKYDEMLKDRPRVVTIKRDAKGRIFDSEDPVASDGAISERELVLTIDQNIQHIAETALRTQFENTGALGGVAIMMNSFTGEILALAEEPSFDPNDYRNFDSKTYKPTSITDLYEPGSTFKLFLAAAAIEYGVAGPNDKFFCENGQYRVKSKMFGEAHHEKFGTLSLTEIIAKSSNIGAIKVAEKLGAKRYYAFLTALGFGSRTGIDLPGEVPGLLRPLKEWSGISLATTSFGQEVSVTAMQIIRAVAALANGGYLVTPHVVRYEVVDGKRISKEPPMLPESASKMTRVMSAETGNKVLQMMSEVVEHGTGGQARIDGIGVVGKTGTSQKYEQAERGYSDSKYIASFVGVFPKERPQIVMLVLLDEPKVHGYGGTIAAPVFQQIALKTSRYLRIPTDGASVYTVQWNNFIDQARRDMAQLGGPAVKSASSDGLVEPTARAAGAAGGEG